MRHSGSRRLRRLRRLFGFSYAVALLASVGLSAPCPAQDESIRVRLVEVPVRVELNGAPVRGLSRSDFRLLVDGKPVPIQTFEELDADAPAADTGLPAAVRRSFLLLFDRELTETALVDRARAAAISFVSQVLDRDALVAVAIYSSEQGVSILVPFTTDRGQAIHAITTFREDRAPEPADSLGLIVTEPQVARSSVARAREPAARAPRQVRQVSPSRLSRAERTSQASDFLASIAALAERLAPLAGHKRVVLFSRGFDSQLLFGEDELSRPGSAFERAQDAFYEPSQAYGDQTLRSVAKEAVEALAAADCSIDALDLGTVGSASATGTDSLRYLTRETGGELLAHRALEDALATLAQRTNHSYLLTFDPGKPLADRSAADTHSIEVQVVDAPKGATVAHRPMFVESAASPADPLHLARRAIADRSGGAIPLELRILPAREPPGDSETSLLVPLVLEVSGPVLSSHAASANLSIEIYGYATDSDGAILDHFAQRLELDTRAVGDRLRRGGLLFLGAFTVPPGRHTARVLVRAADLEQTSLAVEELDVANEAARAASAVVLFPASADDWVVAPGRGARSALDSYVVASTGRPTGVVLRAAPSSTVRLYVRSETTASAGWNAELLGEDGVARALDVRPAGSSEEATGIWLEADLPDVPEGRYTMILRSDLGAGGRPIVSSVDVELRP